MASTVFMWAKGTHFICGLKLQTSGFDTLVGHLVRVTRWCALVQVEAASVLDRRYLALSGRVGIDLGLERCGSCWTSTMLAWIWLLVPRAYFHISTWTESRWCKRSRMSWITLLSWWTRARLSLQMRTTLLPVQLPPALSRRTSSKTWTSTTFTWTTWSLLCATDAHPFLRLDCTAHIPDLRVFWVSDLVVHSRLVAPRDLGTCAGPNAEMAASWRRSPNYL